MYPPAGETTNDAARWESRHKVTEDAEWQESKEMYEKNEVVVDGWMDGRKRCADKMQWS